ncbi:MAG: murein biosynthesis integral membrane protein MurJ [Phycisphaeraceae bacterium]
MPADPAPPSSAAASAKSAGDQVGGATLTVSGLTLVSRVTGLVRDAVLAATLGLSAWADIFFLAFLIPNLFRRLFGEGALTSAFIPAYTRIAAADPPRAPRFASAVLLITALITITLMILVLVIIGLLLTSDDLSQRATETLRLTAWMLPYMPLICLVALLGGLLQTAGRFAPAAVAPVLLNLCMIAAALYAASISDESRDIAYALAFAVLIAGILQLTWMIATASRRNLLTAERHGTAPDVRAMAWRMLPMTAGLAVFQINALFDSLIAFLLSPPAIDMTLQQITYTTVSWLPGEPAYPIESGSVAAIQWAQRLYQFPLGVFGIAVATATFPALARAASHRADFQGVLRRGLALALFLTLPASIGLALVARPIVELIYQRGAFDADATARVAQLLTAYGVAVWAYSLTHVLTRACYALDRPSAPLKIMAWTVPLNLALNLTLIWPLGATGLAWSTAIASIAQVLGLLMLLRHHLDPRLLSDLTRTIFATVVMTATILAAGQLVSDAAHPGVHVLVAITVGMCSYALCAWPLGQLRLLGLRSRS